ncbi:MAG: hypothetical protein ACI4MY_03675, partial [Christensenellales bacterium]
YRDYEVVAVDQDRFSYLFSAKIQRGLYKASARLLPIFNRFVGPIRIGTKKDADLGGEDKSTQPKQIDKDGEVKVKYRKIDNVLKRFDPDVVLCLSPKSHDKALKARQKLGKNMPIYAMTTDYCMDYDFINALSDGYFVQNQQVSQALLASGIESQKILVAGTPAKRSDKTYDRETVCRKYGVDPTLPTILMVGGRYGCDYLKDAFSALGEYYRTVNIIVVTSGSKSLKNYIKTYCGNKGIDRNVSLVDNPQDMQELYSITRVLVTSPTAGVTFEAIANALPMVLIKPMNNIEKGNYSYLTSQSLAYCGAGKHQLLSSTLSLLNDEGEYAKAVARLDGRGEDSTPKVCATLTDRASEHRQAMQQSTQEDKTEGNRND